VNQVDAANYLAAISDMVLKMPPDRLAASLDYVLVGLALFTNF
jgi:hypothetical protein